MAEKVVFIRRCSTILILFLSIGLLLTALIPTNLITGKTAFETNTLEKNLSPRPGHLFGTDNLGRDVFVRVLSATRINLSIALGATIGSFLIGTALGALSGFMGGVTDFIIIRLLEIVQSIPGILLGMLIMVLAGSGYRSLIAVITLINIPVYARLVRAEIQPLTKSPVVSAARLSMVPEARILTVYILPAALTSVLAYIPVQAGFSISVAAGFGFIGLGISPPQAEWGMMIRESLSSLLFLKIWWPAIFPSLFLILSVLVLYGLGSILSRSFK